MCQHDHIAVDVSGVTKRFVKSDGLRWPWKRNDNGCMPSWPWTASVSRFGVGTKAVTGQAIDTNHMILYLLVGTLVWHYLAVVFDNVSEMIA